MCPRVTLAHTAPISIIRPTMCASGRNSSVDALSVPFFPNRGPSTPTALRTSARKFAWVSTQPFGGPVVPEV